MRPRIYISGPITLGDRQHNLQQAMDAGKVLYDTGYAPFIPHLTMCLPYAWDIAHEVWIAADLPWVLVSEAVLRLPGESKGADAECDFAAECDIPVFHSIDALHRHFESRLPDRTAVA